jgi:hypothetical protein
VTESELEAIDKKMPSHACSVKLKVLSPEIQRVFGSFGGRLDSEKSG